MSKPMRIEWRDFEALDPWVRRVLKLSFRERLALLDPPRGALPPAEAWEDVNRYGRKDSLEADAREQLPLLMRRWLDLYATAEGRKKAAGVVRQRRYRRRAGTVTLDLPADVHQALSTAATRRGMTLVELLREWMERETNKSDVASPG